MINYQIKGNMNPASILPDLQSSLLCEEVRQETNGNFLIIGILHYLRVPQLPVMVSRLCVFNCWTAGVGQFTETVRLLAPDQTTELRKRETRFELPGPESVAVSVTVFTQMEFKAAGTYFVEVQVDEARKLRYPVTVILASPPAQNAAPPAETKPSA